MVGATRSGLCECGYGRVSFTQDMLSYQQWMHESVGRFPTLVLGPSGSGKEIVARAIGLSRFIPYDSQTGQFASKPRDSFRPVNLSALSETLIESELFGHRQGLVYRRDPGSCGNL